MMDSHIHIVDTVLSSGFEQVEIQIMFSKSWHPWFSTKLNIFVTSTSIHLMMDTIHWIDVGVENEKCTWPCSTTSIISRNHFWPEPIQTASLIHGAALKSPSACLWICGTAHWPGAITIGHYWKLSSKDSTMIWSLTMSKHVLLLVFEQVVMTRD